MYNLWAGKPLESWISEVTLVRMAQQGDWEMFARLYEAYNPRIYRYVSFRVPDEALAEDITADIFLKIWKNLNTYQGGQSAFVTWIYRIAHNTVVDYYRTRKVSVSMEAIKELCYYDDVEEKLDNQLQSQQLCTAMASLTKEQKQVLLLKFVDGMSTAEIAQKTHKQKAAIRALQMRGLQKLSKCLTLQKGQSSWTPSYPWA